MCLSLSLSRASISCFTVRRQGTQKFDLRVEYNKIYPLLQRLRLLACTSNTAVYQHFKETHHLQLYCVEVIKTDSNLLALNGVASAHGNQEDRSLNPLTFILLGRVFKF